MAENARPPVAIRIVRPYENEDDLLEGELETFGKTSVILVGAHPRPTGVILRFEMTLATGAPVLRGEGRVLAHKENAFRGHPGLVLRFTRLDPKSKAFVDRASVLRDARAPISSRPQPPDVAAGPSHPPVRVDSPIAEALSAPTPPPGPSMSVTEQELAVANARAAARERANALARTNARRTGWPSSMTDAPHGEHEAAPASSPVPAAPESTAQGVMSAGECEEIHHSTVSGDAPEPDEREPASSLSTSASALSEREPTAHLAELGAIAPEERNALLSRLRTRAAELSADRVAEILSSAPRK